MLTESIIVIQLYIQSELFVADVSWNALKSERLKFTRGVSFEEILSAKLIAVKEHPVNRHQQIMLFDYKGYIWLVPFVRKEDGIFLKTLYPSRKYTKFYRGGKP